MQKQKFAPLEAVVLPDLPPPRRPWPRWLLVCGALALAVGLMSAALWGVGRLATSLRGSGGDADSLVDHWETPAERLENIAAAMNATEIGCSPGELRAFERVLTRIAASSREADNAAYQSSIDLNLLIRRISRHPVAPSDRSLAMWMLKSDLQTSLETPTGLGEFSIVRVERGRRPDQVLVYTVEADYFQTAAFRWWLARAGRNWRVFDYERLDHGQTLAAGWAIRGAIDNDPHRYNYYNLQTALSSPSGGQYGAGVATNNSQLESTLDRYIDAPLPAVARDVTRLDLAWALIGESRPTAALTVCDKIDNENENPGVHIVRARAWEMLGRPAKALAETARYQQAAGRDPQALIIEAEAHESLEDFAAAASKWGALLTLFPEHNQALANYCRLADETQLAQVPAIVARRRQPLEAAAVQAQAALHREDEATFDALLKFISERSPGSPQLDALAGSKLSHEGQHAAAAAMFLKASQAEWLPEKKQERFNQYLMAMTQGNQAVTAYEQAEDPDAAFHYLTDGFESGEAWITVEQLKPLLAAHRARKGGSFMLEYLEGLLLLRDKHPAEAESKFAAAAGQASEDYEREMCRDRRIEALIAQGKGDESYRQFGQSTEVFQAVAREYQNRQQWDDLRRLIDAHRRNMPGDMWIDFYLAIELQGRGEYREALAAIRRAEQAGDASLTSYCQWIKTEIALQAGDGLATYSESADREMAFANLANRLVQAEDWQQLGQLVQLHSTDATSPAMLGWATRGPFELGDYEQVIGRLAPWPSFARTAEPLEVEVLHERLVRSLLRLGRREEARTAAERASRDLEFHLPLVMVLLAEGRFPELCERLADLRLLREVQQRALDSDPELRQLLHTAELAEFRASVPWPMPSYPGTGGHFALLLHEPAANNPVQMKELLAAAGIPTDALHAIPPAAGDPRTSYLVGTEFGTLVVSFGAGAVHDKDNDEYGSVVADESLRRVLDEHGGHTIVDFERAALEPGSQRVAAQAARLAAALSGEGTLAVTGWQGTGQYWMAPANPATMERLSSGELLSDKSPADVRRLSYPVLLSRPALPGDPAGDAWTAHHRNVQQLSRQVDRGTASPQEILVELWRGHARERRWLKLTGVRKANYAQREFVGQLTEQSILWPYLRPGLRLAVQPHEVLAIRPASDGEA